MLVKIAVMNHGLVLMHFLSMIWGLGLMVGKWLARNVGVMPPFIVVMVLEIF
jgi:hypothetical protein